MPQQHDFGLPNAERWCDYHHVSGLSNILALSNLGHPRRSFVEVLGTGLVDSAVRNEGLMERSVSSAHDFWQVRLGRTTQRGGSSSVTESGEHEKEPLAIGAGLGGKRNNLPIAYAYEARLWLSLGDSRGASGVRWTGNTPKRR